MPSEGAMRLAKLISATLNAPLIAALTFTILVAASGSPSWPSLLLVSVLFAAVVPILILYAFKEKKIIPDMYASDRKTRTLPFLASVASYLVGYAVLFLMKAPPLITVLMLCYAVNTVVMTMITLVWKISIHASGVAGPSCAFGRAFGPVGYLFLLLVIPVGWARVTLKAHSPVQVIAGAALSFLLTYFELSIWLPA